MGRTPAKTASRCGGPLTMGSPYGKAHVIGLASTVRRITGPAGESLEELLGASGVDFDLRTGRNHQQVHELARRAAAEGKYLVAAGDDRLIHEVVNGMLGEDPQSDSGYVLAVIPGQRRSNFTRTFGLPEKAADAVAQLGGEPYFAVDVGKVTLSWKGRSLVRCFVNMAEVGIGAGIVRRAARYPAYLGRGGDLLSFWASLLRFKPQRAQIALDKRSLDMAVCNVIVANGQFFRDGMRIAPKAHPSDGRFDSLVMKGTKRDYIAALTKSRKGDHVPDPSIREYMAEKVEVRSERPLEVQADEKFLGHTPAVFEIVPNAFKLKI